MSGPLHALAPTGTVLTPAERSRLAVLAEDALSRGDLGGASVDIYRVHVREFLSVAGADPSRPLMEVVEDFAVHIDAERDWTESTQRQARFAVQYLLRWLVPQMRELRVPWPGVHEESDLDVLEPGEAAFIYRASGYKERPQEHLVLALAHGAGMLPLEMQPLQWDAFDYRGGRLRIPATHHRDRRWVPVADRVLAVARHYQMVGGSKDLVFPGSQLGEPLATSNISRAGIRAIEASSLADKSVRYRALRHTFAVERMAEGVAEEQLAEWMPVHPEYLRRYRRPAARRVLKRLRLLDLLR